MSRNNRISTMLTALLGVLAIQNYVNAQTLSELIKARPDMTEFAALLQQPGADLMNFIDSKNQIITVFAPVNGSFYNLPTWPDYKMKYMKAHPNVLMATMRYHMTPQLYNWSSAAINGQVPTMVQKYPPYNGPTLTLEYDGESPVLYASNAYTSVTCDQDLLYLLGPPIPASNGFLQPVSGLLTPPDIICPNQLLWAQQKDPFALWSLSYDCRSSNKLGVLLSAASTTEIDVPLGLGVSTTGKSPLLLWTNDGDDKYADSMVSQVAFTGPATVDISTVTQFANGLLDPQGMDVDNVNGIVYFTEHGGQQVLSQPIGGGRPTVIWADGLSEPTDVAVDGQAGLVFIAATSALANEHDQNGTIVMVDVNSPNKTSTTIMTGLTRSYGLCLDTYGKRLYYVQGGHGGSISCFAYNTTKCNTQDGSNSILIPSLDYPYMCTVDTTYAPFGGPTKIIYTLSSGTVMWVNDDNSDSALIASNPNPIMGVKVASVFCGPPSYV